MSRRIPLNPLPNLRQTEVQIEPRSDAKAHAVFETRSRVALFDPELFGNHAGKRKRGWRENGPWLLSLLNDD